MTRGWERNRERNCWGDFKMELALLESTSSIWRLSWDWRPSINFHYNSFSCCSPEPSPKPLEAWRLCLLTQNFWWCPRIPCFSSQLYGASRLVWCFTWNRSNLTRFIFPSFPKYLYFSGDCLLLPRGWWPLSVCSYRAWASSVFSITGKLSKSHSRLDWGNPRNVFIYHKINYPLIFYFIWIFLQGDYGGFHDNDTLQLNGLSKTVFWNDLGETLIKIYQTFLISLSLTPCPRR